jgi:hypothetical protein
VLSQTCPRQCGTARIVTGLWATDDKPATSGATQYWQAYRDRDTAQHQS